MKPLQETKVYVENPEKGYGSHVLKHHFDKEPPKQMVERLIFCFTKEELEELLKDVYREGYGYDGRQKLYPLSGMNKAPSLKSMTEYIKQLLP